MKPHTIENEIREQAFEALTRQIGCKMTYQPLPGQDYVDGRVELQVEHGKYLFNAEVKARITGPDTLFPLLRLMNRPEEFLVITRQLKGEMAEQLRKNGIQFIDDAGNAYINRPPFYLFIKGNRNPDAGKPVFIGRAFKQTGLRVLYALLCNPGMENETYRMIAGKTDVALGMINWVMRELRELGYLAGMGTGRNKDVRLINKAKLLERWIPAYVEQLRPKLFLGRFRGAGRWWENADLDLARGLWGGEVAAARMTDYLSPEEVIIYAVNENPTEMLAQFRLKKDPQGNVELYTCFWKPETIIPNGNMVHPMLVYADLVATGNQRNLETARMIYEQHVVQLVGED
jgi:hypothetical protein